MCLPFLRMGMMRVPVKPSIKYSQQADDKHFHKFTAMHH